MLEPERDDAGLSPRERTLLARQLRRKRWPLVLCALSLGACASFLGYHVLAGRLDGPRLVIVLLLAIAAKNHLRTFRLTTLLEKLASRRAPSARPPPGGSEWRT